MLNVNLCIISELKNFAHMVTCNGELLNKFKLQDGAFTRNRKLPFEKLILLIIGLCKRTLSVELEDFYKEIGDNVPCSASAFTQQRSKLNPTFFYWWNIVLWSSFYHYSKNIKRWKGYRIIAADGSNVSLVNTPALEKYFGGQSNQQGCFVQAKTFYYYDVLNELVLYPNIKPYRFGEMKMAQEGISHLSDDMLAIYDRHFASFTMVALHVFQEKEIKFVIRANEKRLIIKNFILSGASSCIADMTSTPRAIRELKLNGFVINKESVIKVRLIRVELENTVEVLITNLWEEDGHPDNEFKELYFQRWGVETNISFQKNIQKMESFSGLTVESVIQDFYATIFVANLHMVLIKNAQKQMIQKMKHRKHPMKINNNKSYGRLKRNLLSLFIKNNPTTILLELTAYFKVNLLPIRKGRFYPRVRKNKQSNSKHKMFTNYKPSF